MAKAKPRTAKPAKQSVAKPAKKPVAKKPAKPVAKPAKPVAKPAKPAKPPEAKPPVAKPAKPSEAKPAKPPDAKPPDAKPAKPPEAKPAPADPAFAPANFQTRDDGSFELFFDIDAFHGGDVDIQAAFAKFDLTGNGYEWEAVLAPALKRAHPAAFTAIEWDGSEADTFVVSAKDKVPLATLAAVLRDVLRTQTSLEAAIARHDPDRT